MPTAEDSLASLGESLTALVRTAQPACTRLGCALHFDYLGLAMFPARDVQALTHCMRRLIDRGLSQAQGAHGSLFLTVHAWPLSTTSVLVTCRLAYTLSSEGQAVGKLSSMCSHAAALAPVGDWEALGMDRHALLHSMHAGIEPTCTQHVLPKEGAVIELRLALPYGGPDAEPAALMQLATVSAWLIGALPEDGFLLAQRLQRDGWLVRQFPDIDGALHFWRTSEGALEPALVLVTGANLTEPGALLAARGAWSPHCRIVHGVSSDDGAPLPCPGVEVRKMPFSPADMRELMAFASTLEASRKTQSCLNKRDGARLRPVALVVDDSLVNRTLATEMLQSLGYECDTAVNGREAVEYVERHRPDVILMDLEMPLMDGMEATERIRRYEMHGAGMEEPIPIIASTSRDEQDVSNSWQAIGMSAFVPKPLAIGRLAAALSATRSERDLKS